MNEQFSEYRIKRKRGIDDLKGRLPEHGATDWWTKEEWAAWEKQKPINDAWNEAYIKQLKEEGRYGEEYVMVIQFKTNPVFDMGINWYEEVKKTRSSDDLLFIDKQNENNGD